MEIGNELPAGQPEAVAAAPVLEPGFFGKLALLFSNPTKLFESLKRNPTWLAPFIACALVMIFVGLIAQPYVMASLKQDMTALYSKIPNMPEDALQKIEQGFDEGSRMTVGNIAKAVIGGFIYRLIPFFVVVTILFFAGSILFGGGAKYKQVMSLYAWILPLWALGAIILLPLMIVKESHNVSLSLGTLVTPDPFNSLYFFLKNISLFNIWAVIVLGIGMSVMYGVTRNKAVVTVFALWAVWILINSFIPFLNFNAAMMGLT